MEAAAELALSLRAAANDRLARYEPLALVAAPLLALLVARAVHAAAAAVADRGLVGLAMAFVKVLPGVSGYIDAQKRKVVEQLQSGGTSSKNNLRTDLPTVGLSEEVIKDLETLKAKDVDWQGKCSGTVYIAGSESDGHFELINKAYSMFSHTNPLHQDVFKRGAYLVQLQIWCNPCNHTILAVRGGINGWRQSRRRFCKYPPAPRNLFAPWSCSCLLSPSEAREARRRRRLDCNTAAPGLRQPRPANPSRDRATRRCRRLHLQLTSPAPPPRAAVSEVIFLTPPRTPRPPPPQQ